MSPKRKGTPGDKSFARTRKIREPNPVILIVCEKTKTEPLYFKRLRSQLRLKTAKIEVRVGKSEPVKLVASAEKFKQEIEAGGVIVDKVWCIFDHDNRKSFDAAIKLAEDKGFEAGYSNPQFELWYLWHFADRKSNISSSGVVNKLKKYIPRYTKTSDVSKFLKDNESAAIKRAQQMRTTHRRNRNSLTANPSTRVDILVKYLIDISDK